MNKPRSAATYCVTDGTKSRFNGIALIVSLIASPIAALCGTLVYNALADNIFLSTWLAVLTVFLIGTLAFLIAELRLKRIAPRANRALIPTILVCGALAMSCAGGAIDVSGNRTAVFSNTAPILFVIDKSGSMSGSYNSECLAATQSILENLPEYQLIAGACFENSITYWEPEQGLNFVQNTPENRRSLMRFLTAYEPYGGTELSIAIDSAVDYMHSPGQIIVATDAVIYSEDVPKIEASMARSSSSLSIVQMGDFSDSDGIQTALRALTEQTSGLYVSASDVSSIKESMSIVVQTAHTRLFGPVNGFNAGRLCALILIGTLIRLICFYAFGAPDGMLSQVFIGALLTAAAYLTLAFVPALVPAEWSTPILLGTYVPCISFYSRAKLRVVSNCPFMHEESPF